MRLAVLSRREASIFAGLADAVAMPTPPMASVAGTDAVAGFDVWLARAPRRNRIALRASLLGLGVRLRGMDRVRRAEALQRLGRSRMPLVPQLLDALHASAAAAYYGDAGVMRDLGYDAGERVRTGRAVRAAAPLTPTGGVVDGSRITGERIVRADVCVIGSGAGGAVVAKELAESGMRVVLLEEGEHITADAYTARPRDMLPRLYRDAAQHATIGRPPILLPLGRAVGGTTLVNSGTCFRTPDAVLARWRSERPRRAPRRRGARLVGRLDQPQRARLRRLGRVCVRLPGERQAARRRHLRPEGAHRGGHDLQRRARSPHRADRPPRQRRRRGDLRWRPAARALRHGRRRRGRDPHPGAARPQRARWRLGPARAQPLAAPRDRRVGRDGRGRRHGARRPAVLLHRRVRLRRDHARGHRGAAGLRRDGPARRRRAPPRADGRLPLDGAVRADGPRRLARARALARRAPGRALRHLRRRHRARQARPRAPGGAVLGRGRALGAAADRAAAGAPRRRLVAAARTRPAPRAHGRAPEPRRPSASRSTSTSAGRGRSGARAARAAGATGC